MLNLIHVPWGELSYVDAQQKVESLICVQNKRINTILSSNGPFTWDNLVAPLEEMRDELDTLWKPFSHLQEVLQPTDSYLRFQTRLISAHCNRKIYEFSFSLSQDIRLYRAICSISSGEEYRRLSLEQKAVVRNLLRQLRMSGVCLSSEKRNRLKEIDGSLLTLQKNFEDNVEFSEREWKKRVDSPFFLNGLPDDIIDSSKQTATAEGESGYSFRLSRGSYVPVMKYARNRDFREEFCRAYESRASDIGPNSAFHDNGPIIERIIAMRNEKAKILGFGSFVKMSLSSRMVQKERSIFSFLEELITHFHPLLMREYGILSTLAREKDGILKLEVWDIEYYTRLWKEETLGLSEAEISEYFPIEKVITGMFEIARRLYGITFVEKQEFPVWHKNVRFFEVFSPEGYIAGGLYLDLFERFGTKQSGMWMSEGVNRRKTLSGEIQMPVGNLICNFRNRPPGLPILLTLEEVDGVLHEFGHNLHLLLTKMIECGVSGLRGVPCDGRELPSQFMENFCRFREGLEILSGHYQTGEKLPTTLIEKLSLWRTFGAGYFVSHRAMLSLFDLIIHSGEQNKEKKSPLRIYRELYERIFPYELPAFSRLPNYFMHIFANNYEAGYYSYLWSEALSADAFSVFLESDGIVNWNIGKKFEKEILAIGGSRSFLGSFIAFRGREPNVNALLRQYGSVR